VLRESTESCEVLRDSNESVDPSSPSHQAGSAWRARNHEMVSKFAMPGGAGEVAVFVGKLQLGTRLKTAGLLNGDIIYVVPPLPKDWHLAEDDSGKVFYFNSVTAEQTDVLKGHEMPAVLLQPGESGRQSKST